MKENRFISNYDGSMIIDRKDCLAYAFHSGAEEPVIDLLNSLYDEILMLKGEVAHYKLFLMSLEKEAKKLTRIPKAKRDVE